MNTIERNYQFRERMAVVHKTDRRDFDKKCPEGFVEVTSDWCIAIPKDADVVMILFRENPETPETVKLLIEKNRHGSTGDIDLHWDGKYTKFTSIDTHGY